MGNREMQYEYTLRKFLGISKSMLGWINKFNPIAGYKINTKWVTGSENLKKNYHLQ